MQNAHTKVSNFHSMQRYGKFQWMTLKCSAIIQMKNGKKNGVGGGKVIVFITTISIEEAAAYFRIGENKLRKIISENKDADFVLWNGTRSQIKRKKFENYIDRLNVI